ncbi:TolC family outer membrane protein [Massilia endophytica]|uniref:TolC family outer membrane protein n=1 Tax=Massilia endophytica TaxID=2899220 RepID=UPI001E2C0323|nr:TolC family outer membrane protein [Massilia endophytica]UGQ45470.1 TolC family outer membrane protein [Massilia endophytica]
MKAQGAILKSRAARAVCGAMAVLALSHAGSASAIGLMQAYQTALKNDPTYRVAQAEYEAGLEYKNIGRAGLLPNLSANYAASKVRADVEGRDILNRETLTHPKYVSRVGNVQLRQTLINFDALARYKQGKAQTEVASHQFDAQGQELALRVTSAYIDALFSNEQLKLATAQRETLREQRKVNDRLFQKGEGTKTDMLETQAKLDIAEAEVLEAQDALRTNLATLSGIVGEEVTSLDELVPEFRMQPVKYGSFEEWLKSALDNNPELEAQRSAIEVAHQEVNKSRAGHTPKLDFVATYSKNDSETLNTYTQDSTQRSVGIQLTVPLYSGGYVNAVTRQAVAGQERARAELQARIDKITVELRKQYGTVMSSVQRLQALDKAVESSKLLVKATQQSILGGVRINLDLLNAQQQLYTNQRDLARARYNYLVSGLRLRAAAGMLTFDDVREVASYFR